MPSLVIWNQAGPEATAAISAAVPGVSVVDIERDPPGVPEPQAQVLLAVPRRDLPRARLPYVDVSWAESVQWVHATPTGIDQFPPALFHNKMATCGRGLSGSAIAEFVMAAVLGFEKRMPEIWASRGEEYPSQLGRAEGKTLGIVGFGAIGRAVAQRALPFGMSVLAARRTSSHPGLEGVRLVGLEELLSSSDHIVLAAPSTTETFNLLDRRRLALVRPGSHLVNVARGTLVDNDALVHALDEGRLALATLDVVEPEPLPDVHPLRAHPRVRISQHISGSVQGVRECLVQLFIDNLRRFQAGQPLAGEIDTELGY